MKKGLSMWLSEYGEHHTHPRNKSIHFACVPAIFWSIAGLLFQIKLPAPLHNLMYAALIVVLFYYAFLSWKLLPGMLVVCLFCLFSWEGIESWGIKPWHMALPVFAAAWIGQFIGHSIEGKKPSFLKDLQFLLIGPAWTLAFLYKKVGINLFSANTEQGNN
jgi:uncharacterized membrane protein YGL010W